MATVTINPTPVTTTSGMSDPRADKLREILDYVKRGDDHKHDQACIPALLAEWDHVRDLIEEVLEDF